MISFTALFTCALFLLLLGGDYGGTQHQKSVSCSYSNRQQHQLPSPLYYGRGNNENNSKEPWNGTLKCWTFQIVNRRLSLPKTLVHKGSLSKLKAALFKLLNPKVRGRHYT